MKQCKSTCRFNSPSGDSYLKRCEEPARTRGHHHGAGPPFDNRKHYWTWSNVLVRIEDDGTVVTRAPRDK